MRWCKNFFVVCRYFILMYAIHFQVMRWFRKQDESPRLLSLSPLRLSESVNDSQLYTGSQDGSNCDFDIRSTPRQTPRHRSRIGKSIFINLLCLKPWSKFLVSYSFRYNPFLMDKTSLQQKRNQFLQCKRWNSCN